MLVLLASIVFGGFFLGLETLGAPIRAISAASFTRRWVRIEKATDRLVFGLSAYRDGRRLRLEEADNSRGDLPVAGVARDRRGSRDASGPRVWALQSWRSTFRWQDGRLRRRPWPVGASR